MGAVNEREVTARACLGFVYGVLDADRVPGPVLVEVMSHLGVTAPAVRQLFARMLKAGDLAGERHGRVSVYRLDGLFREQWLRMRQPVPPPTWDGAFHCVVHDIAEQHRRQREALLTAAQAAGYGVARPGLLIGVTPPRFLPDPPPVGLVVSGRLKVDLPQARRLADTAWDLPARSRLLRDVADTLEGRVRAVEGLTGEQALRSLQELYWEGGRARLAGPSLPAELVPEGWPEGRLQDLLTRAARAHLALTGPFLYDLLSRSPHAHLVRSSWWPPR